MMILGFRISRPITIRSLTSIRILKPQKQIIIKRIIKTDEMDPKNTKLPPSAQMAPSSAQVMEKFRTTQRITIRASPTKMLK